MSLINDALKRAQESQQKNPPPHLPPIPPAENKSGGGKSFLPALIIVLIFAAGIFIGLAVSHNSQRRAQAQRLNTQVNLVSLVPTSAPTQKVEALVPTIPKSKPTNAIAAVSNSVETLKVQGIVYDLKRPWAIVAGKTVFVGDKVRDFRVTRISKDAVTLQANDGSITNLKVSR
jgi:predicted DNA-binding transcriptional regulator YafY